MVLFIMIDAVVTSMILFFSRMFIPPPYVTLNEMQEFGRSLLIRIVTMQADFT